MAKFNRVGGDGRGRPRANKANRKGNVRITAVLTGEQMKGNVTRTLTVADSTVTEVFAALEAALVGKAAAPAKAAAKK